jgi:hypothetical protein
MPQRHPIQRISNGYAGVILLQEKLDNNTIFTWIMEQIIVISQVEWMIE